MKIGIVTMYHDNINYGGNLQAYALLQFCKTLGYDAEIISFEPRSKVRYLISDAKKNILQMKNIFSNTEMKRYYNCVNDRRKAVLSFNAQIPHSRLYYPETISKANSKYNCFIVGSDQVWNPYWLNSAYSLQFAEKKKYCISYAASLGVSELTNEQETVFIQILDRLNSISVREERSIELLGGLTEKNINYVLDPTLILEREQWEKICAERQIKTKYVFCFFFGNQEKPRNIAAEYAKRNGYKLVTIPFLSNRFRAEDCSFGDIRLSNVSPEEFLSLIKYSEFVFTDSFHATVFSHIFEKQFIVYAENLNKTRVRMLSLTQLFGTQNRFIGDEVSTDIDYVESLADIKYDNDFSEYSKCKEYSKEFLISNLRQAEKYDRNHKTE